LAACADFVVEHQIAGRAEVTVGVLTIGDAIVGVAVAVIVLVITEFEGVVVNRRVPLVAISGPAVIALASEIAVRIETAEAAFTYTD